MTKANGLVVPRASSASVLKSMRSNRSQNTSPEIMLRKALLAAGQRGYKANWKKIAGSPDIAYPFEKVAIFVNGCFWHACPYCKKPLPKKHGNFWEKKFETNKKRDKKTVHQLKCAGWKVLTAWECQILKHANKIVDRIKYMRSRKI